VKCPGVSCLVVVVVERLVVDSASATPESFCALVRGLQISDFDKEGKVP
jgi:hypothetical protein